MSDYCRECKMPLKEAGEYHPYAFCVLYKAGLDPLAEVRRIARDLALAPDGENQP